MSASKLSDLLPIEATNGRPNAYEVFGLEPGERDAPTLKAAVKQVYADLKASKASADPETWKQALRLAEDARKLLEDPERRCALDTSLGIESGPKRNSKTAAAASVDPLADLLPKSASRSEGSVAQPAAGSPGAASGGGGATSVLGVPPLGTPPAPTSSLGTPPTSSPAAVQINTGDQAATDSNAGVGWAPQTPAKRRKKKSGIGGTVVFGGFVLLMIGAIVGLLVYLQDGNRITLNASGVEDDNEDGVVVSKPMDPQSGKTPAEKDGILNEVPSSGIAQSLRNPDAEDKGASGIGKFDPMRNGNRPRRNGMKPPRDRMRPGMDPEPDPDTVSDTGATPDPGGTTPSMDTGMKPVDPETTMTDPSSGDGGPSPEMVEANQKKLEAVEQLIRSASWDNMKAEAESAEKLSLNESQAKRAETLYNIADLALYYRGAIERGLASLKTGNTFDYIEDFPVIVVEVNEDSLTIQFNKRSRTYSFDELPPRLMEKIASFALTPDQPDAVAGLALYRLIHPGTSAEYREDAWKLLESVDGQLETVDSKDLQRVAKEILSR